jgi:hypothetical protein
MVTGTATDEAGTDSLVRSARCAGGGLRNDERRFRIDADGDWLGTTVDPDEATLAPLVVCAEGFPMTEVDDTLAK